MEDRSVVMVFVGVWGEGHLDALRKREKPYHHEGDRA